MSARPWIAILLLINYLLVVSMGYVNRSEGQSERIPLQSAEESHHYQQCRYLRMDGLEEFMADALARHYQNDSKAPCHYAVSVMGGVNVHYLVHHTWPFRPLIDGLDSPPVIAYSRVLSEGIRTLVSTPPWPV